MIFQWCYYPGSPKALADFEKPPVDGGLPSGAMSSADQSVDGEMPSVIRAIGDDRGHGGYTIDNWSRCRRRYDPDAHLLPRGYLGSTSIGRGRAP